MSDCPNVEIRELLPELLNGRLDAAAEARVREHLAACVDCAVELQMLQRVHALYRRAPAVDTAAIVRALPARRARPTPALGLLRVAAAIVLVLGGALVMRMAVGGPGATGDSTQIVALDTPLSIASESAVTASRPPRVLAMSLSELDDLDAEELETLLGALDRIEAAPAAEPDTLIGSVPGIGS